MRRRVQQDPASIAFAELAEEYRRAGRDEVAVGVCRAGLEQHPHHVPARVTLGRALFALDRCDEAQLEFETVLRTAPDNFFALRTLAQIQRRRIEQRMAATPAMPVADPGVRFHDDEGRDRHADRNDRRGDGGDVDGRQPPDDRKPSASGALYHPFSSARETTDSALHELERWLDAILSDREDRSHSAV